MKNYIIKRILLIFITLLGISVITFAVTRLAPGDPFSQQAGAFTDKTSQSLTEENIRQNRRIYGFDKPLILNFRFDNKDTNLKTLFSDYINASDIRKKTIVEELNELGVLTLPYLFSKINDEKYLDLCLQLLETIVYPKDITQNVRKRLINLFPNWDAIKLTKQEKVLIWKEWWRENSKKLTEENANIESKKYIFDGKNREELLYYGTLNIPFFISKLETKQEKDLVNATMALSMILKKSWIYEINASKEDKSNVLFRWKTWWRYNEERFIVYPWHRDFFRVFTNSQYGMWLIKIITFDFDESYTYKRPVLQLIGERIPVSIQLSVFSIILTYLLSIPLGIFSATHQNKLSDKVTTVTLFILYSLPSFWVASMLLLFLTGGGGFPNLFPARYLHSLGSENFGIIHYILDWLWHLVLPVFCLTYGSLAYLSRQMRVGMLDVIRQDYIRTARAKGLSEKLVVYKHAFKNALIPIITILSAILPALIGGSIIIEEIFSIDGIGRLTFEAIMNRDYPIINAIAFFSAFLTLIGIFLSDILYAVVDPRIKFTGSKT